jgi:hypothetical protein
MKCWRLTDYEWYAADTLEEAIAAAMSETGLPREVVFHEDYGYEEAESMELWADEERTEMTTVKATLEKMDKPGFAFGTES